MSSGHSDRRRLPSRRLLLTRDLGERWCAGLEDGRVHDLRTDAGGGVSKQGAVAVARVMRIDRAIGCAWVDAGLGEQCMLPFGGRGGREPAVGDRIVVEVTRDRVGSKGPRVRGRPRLAGWRVVLLGGASGVRLSRRLTSAAERARLAGALAPVTGEGFGLIVREFAAAAPDHVLLAEARELVARWEKIERAAREDAAPRIIAEPETPSLAFLRELIDARVERVIAGDPESLEIANRARAEAGENFPEVEMHCSPLPAFDAYGIGGAIDSALRRSVVLSGGGVLLVDRGAAGTTIDVDSAAHTAGPAAASMLELNMEAASAVARQLRLRNASGLVLVDFVDLPRADERERVDGLLRELLARDPCSTRVLPLSEFSVAQITRQRRGAPLSDLVLVPCGACGAGRKPSLPAEARRLLRELRRLAWPKPGGRFRLCARRGTLDEAMRIAREEGVGTGLPALDRVDFVEADPAVAEE